MHCRFCGTLLGLPFADLGDMPLVNRYLTEQTLKEPEPAYPLAVHLCEGCHLVQTGEPRPPEQLFTPEYAYFSSIAPSFVVHARRYAEMMVERFRLNSGSKVVEIASNDGYLLQHFVNGGVPAIGVDPAMACSQAAKRRGVKTIVDYFGSALGERIVHEFGSPDVIVANNVLAHVPDINDFVKGLKGLLGPGGVITIEAPHLLHLMRGVQFDTIYDEHYSYFSLSVIDKILTAHGLGVFDVEEIPTHGGSLRVFACHAGDHQHPIQPAVDRITADERDAGLETPDAYAGFQDRMETIRDEFLEFVRVEKRKNKRFAAFGAAAKGNIFLNYCRLGPEEIEFVADDTPAKQNCFLPGTHIPVVSAERLRYEKPDFVVVLPWNLAEEIIENTSFIRKWGGQFVVCIPRLRIV